MNRHIEIALVIAVFGGLAIAMTHFFGPGTATAGLVAAIGSRIFTYPDERRAKGRR